MMLRQALRALVATVFVASTLPSEAWAIPAFARKYGTSCQTCHVAYPKLNAFGESFRLRGYQLPDETEDQIKQPDVSLGADAHKRVWPDAVWPGKIPPSIPLALATNFLSRNRSRAGAHGKPGTDTFDFIFPESVGLIVGGTAGEHVAFFGEIEFEQAVENGVVETDVSVKHIDMRFTNLIKSSPVLNVKIGSFQPELVVNFDHARRLTIANYDSMFGVGTIDPGGAQTVGGGAGIALPAIVRGIELFGIVAKRLSWSLGVVNGLEGGEDTLDANSSKDFYGRAAWKFGGLAPDGSNATTYAASPKNWRERSFRIGAFFYQGYGSGYFSPFEVAAGPGDARDAAPADESPPGSRLTFTEDSRYSRLGGDFNWYFKDINVFGAFVRGEDELGVFAEDPSLPGQPGAFEDRQSGTFRYTAWFVEADAVLRYPWLQGALRYESVDLPGEHDGEPVSRWERGTVSLTALLRANVKTVIEYTRDLNEGRNNEFDVLFGIAF